MLGAVFSTAFGSHIARVGDSELRPAENGAVIPSRPECCSMYSGACQTARTTYRRIFARCLVCRIMVRACVLRTDGD
jgi:hypothetical protein